PLLQRLHRAFHFDLWGVVATHRVQRDADHLVLDGHPLLAVVIPAGRADTMGLLHVATARTGLQRGKNRLVVCAARALLALRGSALRYCHSDRPLVKSGACLLAP